ncbi:hypothetical protein BEH94_06110 [Candidatus Altiarchaeales archaeon WOR_SM1_SCG]|nr:hypothetical protein BEH94_06110 [Candidatus Altiarchaeales archaeon WOR_SM1_SCG]
MRYALTIKGKVQDVGYRKIIEQKAKDRGLKGYVFNDVDGTVKLVCEGVTDRIDDFIDVINLHEKNIFVADILKNEVVPTYPIPKIFGRIETDTSGDVVRKLEKGLDTLGGIKDDTRALREGQDNLLVGQDKLIGGQDKLIGGQDNLLVGQDKLIGGQDKLIGGQDKLLVGQDKLIGGQDKIISILESSRKVMESSRKDQKTVIGLLEKIAEK